MKTYEVSDLFYTSWPELDYQTHAQVYALQQAIESTSPDSVDYGHLLISILRRLRKRKLLVDKINEEQAVDIYNDLKFLREPWYNFPVLKNKVLPLVQPEEHLARHTFDHFIYADNEYTSLMAATDAKEIRRYARRLVVTLYKLPGETHFDKESVEHREMLLLMNIADWQLNLVVFTYAHVRNFLTKRCKTLLPAPVRSADDEPNKPVPTGKMWLTLKHRLAETPAFQGYDTAGRSNMYSSLDYLEDLSQQKANAKT